MTTWAHLPNAAHIDRVLANLKAHPERWSAAWSAPGSAAWSATHDAAWSAAHDAARGAAQGAARGAAWSAAWRAAWRATWSAAHNTAHRAAWGAITALIAYDDAAIFLPKPIEHLRTLYRIDPHPMFLLLQPAAIAMSSHEITP